MQLGVATVWKVNPSFSTTPGDRDAGDARFVARIGAVFSQGLLGYLPASRLESLRESSVVW